MTLRCRIIGHEEKPEIRGIETFTDGGYISVEYRPVCWRCSWEGTSYTKEYDTDAEGGR